MTISPLRPLSSGKMLIIGRAKGGTNMCVGLAETNSPRILKPKKSLMNLRMLCFMGRQRDMSEEPSSVFDQHEACNCASAAMIP